MSNDRDHLDEIIEQLELEREESNNRNEQLAKIEAKRYELTLGDEQDSLGEIRKDSLKTLDPQDETIEEVKNDDYQFEESIEPSAEQKQNEREKLLDEIIQMTEKSKKEEQEYER